MNDAPQPVLATGEQVSSFLYPYLVFAGASYYPKRGWKDFRGAFAQLEDALTFAASLAHVDWWQIVDATCLRIVKERSL